MNKKVAITGGSGFIGSGFISKYKDTLDLLDLNLRDKGVESLALHGIQSFVYSVGIAHVKKAEDDPEFFEINEELALSCAKKAKSSGVRQFIYISSTMVYGQGSQEAYNEDSMCTPVNAAGKSKQRAEIRIKSLADENFKVAIIRPSLVYGKGVKGNLYSFLKLADSPLPLPFKDVHNQRAMVSIHTLIDAIYKVIREELDGTFVISDRDPVSTEELMTTLRTALGRNPRLFKLPASFMRLFARFRPNLYNKLFGSFSVSCDNSLNVLGLTAQSTFESGIKEMVDHYRIQN